jgi:hypothetical protein
MLGTMDVLKDKGAVRKVLGYLPQEFGVYPRVSAYQMLDHIALLKGVTTRWRAQGAGGSPVAEGEPVGAPQAPASPVSAVV